MVTPRRFGARYPRLLTFWDIVKQFRAADLVEMATEVSEDLVNFRGASKDELRKWATQTKWRYQRYKKLSDEVGLPTGMAIQRVVIALESYNTSPMALASQMAGIVAADKAREMVPLMTVVHGRLVDDLRAFAFFSMSIDESSRYSSPELGWDKSFEWFNSAAFDMSEANKCLACGLSTACVFHVCRATEAVLRTLAKTLGDQALRKEKHPRWGSIMKQMRAVRDETVPSRRPPRWRSKVDHDYLAGLVRSMEGVQKVWRNPVAHPERPFTEDEAHRILPAIQSLLIEIGVKTKEPRRRKRKGA